MVLNVRGGRILVGLDGSPGSTGALRWAREEAGRRDAEVEAVYVWQVPSLAYSAPGFIPPTDTEIQSMGQTALDSALQGLAGPPEVKVSLRVCEGSPADVIAEASREADVAVVVVGSRGLGGIAGLFLGSVSHALTHHCHKPLVIVPNLASQGTAEGRIVVGVDGSATADKAFQWAATEAALRNSRLDAVAVWSPSDSGDSHAANDILERAAKRVDLAGARVEMKAVEGSPAHTLLRLAATAEMLVVGSRGHGRAREAFSGSVSHACSQHSTAPVVIVPHDAP